MVLGELQKTVGENLRVYRRLKGLSQEDFAEVLGVHRTYLGGVERGERNLTLQSVEKLAEQIRVSPMELLRSPPSAEALATAAETPLAYRARRRRRKR